MCIQGKIEGYQDNLKENDLNFVENSENYNNNYSQLSGISLLNQLCELDSPKDRLNVRNFKIQLQEKDQANTSFTKQSSYTNFNSINKINCSNNYQNTSIGSKIKTATTTVTTTTSSSTYQKRNIPYLEQFEKIKLLCETNRSSVYLVQKDNVPLAMKIIRKEQIKYSKQMQSVWRERIILQKLDSSYTVRLEYAFADQENIYLVTDYKPHGTLYQYMMNNQNDITLKDIKRIIAQTVACLQYLHEEQRILYRGLQLENILMDELMNVCLCDFGNSKQMRSKKQANTSYILDMTEENQSPEQIKEKHQDSSSDYWQLGILAYQLIYRRHPFIGESRRQTLSNISNTSILFPQLSFLHQTVTSDFIEFISYCLTLNPSKRPHTFYDIQQTSLFSGFDWQEILEGYSSKYSSPKDCLHRCANLQFRNNLQLSSDYNPYFFNSINNDHLFVQENYQDIISTIPFPNQNKLIYNNNKINNLDNQIEAKNNICQRSCIQNSKHFNQKQSKKEEFENLNLNNSFDGDDENDPNEEDLIILKKSKKLAKQNLSKQTSPHSVFSDKKEIQNIIIIQK